MNVLTTFICSRSYFCRLTQYEKHFAQLLNNNILWLDKQTRIRRSGTKHLFSHMVNYHLYRSHTYTHWNPIPRKHSLHKYSLYIALMNGRMLIGVLFFSWLYSKQTEILTFSEEDVQTTIWRSPAHSIHQRQTLSRR